MIAFLTSSPGGYYEEYGVRKPYKFDERNGLWYELQGDYYSPCLKLSEKEQTNCKT